MLSRLKSIHRFTLSHLLTLFIPMLIPLIVLGSLSTFLIKLYIHNQIDNNNVNLLSQTKSNLELSFSQIDSLNLNFSHSPELIVMMKDLLKTGLITEDNFKLFHVIRNFINAPVYAQPFIYSVYVYFDNDNRRFLSSETGLETVNHYYDSSWYKTYMSRNSEQVWTERRTLNRPPFNSTVDVFSIYKKLSLASGDGVIVLNVKADYVQSMLQKLPTINSQVFLILDEKNRILFKSSNAAYVNQLNLQFHPSKEPVAKNVVINSQSYRIDAISSTHFGWEFVSIVPKSQLYRLPNKLLSLTAWLLLASTFIGLFLAYSLSKRNYQTLQMVIAILQSAEQGQPLPPALTGKRNDIYGYVTEKLIKKFIETEFLSIQLSERKYKLQVMEYIALHSQLNPHFLYNTLETIYWKVASYTGKPNEANEMIENLSGILRYSLDSSERFVPFGEEIKYTKRYLDIQNTRYKDNFDVVWKYDDSQQHFPILKLILQPIIENSIYHGIRLKEGKCIIRIKARIANNFVRLTITDTGLGMEKARLVEVTTRLASEIDGGQHIGLLNTHKRLKITYGEMYSIKLLSKKGRGTSISLTFPVSR